MTRRNRSRNQHAAAREIRDVPPSQPAGRPSTVVRYSLLAIGCLAVAGVVALVISLRTPLPELPPAGLPLAAPPAISQEPTITLPTQPAAASAEQLRAELEALGDDLLQQFPQVPQALHVAAQLKADLQQTTEAIDIWRRCIKIAPRQPGPYAGLATALMALGQDDEAASLLRQALADGCSAPDLHRQLAAALTKLGELDEAEAALHKGMQAFPPTAEDWRQLGQLQLESGQFEQAEASLKQALSQGHAADNVLFSLASACARQGKDAEAAEYRERFALQRKAQSSVSVEFQDRYDDQMRRIAVAALAKGAAVYDHHGQAERAEECLLRACSLAPDDAAACGDLGSLFRKQGRMADALAAHERLVQLEPQVAAHYVNVASLALLLGNEEQAEATLKTLIGVRPDLAVGYSSLARLYLQTGDTQQARWFAEAALKQPDSSPEESVTAHLLLAAACEQAGDARAAQAAIEAARRLSPGDPRLPPPAPK